MAGTEWVVAGGGLIAAIGTAARELRGRGGARVQIRADAELLALLPDDSTAREVLKAHIDSAVRRLVSDDQTLRRDWSAVGIGIALLVMALGGGLFLAGRHMLWFEVPVGLGVVFFGTMGLYGIGEGLGRAERDNRGRRIKPDTPEAGANSGAGELGPGRP